MLCLERFLVRGGNDEVTARPEHPACLVKDPFKSFIGEVLDGFQQEQGPH
jgi:hypothetical protein